VFRSVGAIGFLFLDCAGYDRGDGRNCIEMSLKHSKIALQPSTQSCDDGFWVKPKIFKMEITDGTNRAA
jgi:hypothetical protein